MEEQVGLSYKKKKRTGWSGKTGKKFFKGENGKPVSCI